MVLGVTQWGTLAGLRLALLDSPLTRPQITSIVLQICSFFMPSNCLVTTVEQFAEEIICVGHIIKRTMVTFNERSGTLSLCTVLLGPGSASYLPVGQQRVNSCTIFPADAGFPPLNQ